MTLKTTMFILPFWIALLIAGKVSANLNELGVADTQDSMVWPMLPNESLTELAAKIYPNNKSMQRKFIFETKRLNKENQTGLEPNVRYSALTAIVIPNLKSLSATAGAIKPLHKKTGKKPLRLSYNIESSSEKAKSTVQNIPTRLIEEYEKLVSRNSFLKEEIDKLNKRLMFLQNKLGELKLIFDKSLTLPAKKTHKNLDVEKVIN